MQHREVLVSEQDFFNALPHLIWTKTKPIGVAVGVSLFFGCQLGAERVTS